MTEYARRLPTHHGVATSGNSSSIGNPVFSLPSDITPIVLGIIFETNMAGLTDLEVLSVNLLRVLG